MDNTCASVTRFGEILSLNDNWSHWRARNVRQFNRHKLQVFITSIDPLSFNAKM